jgi:catechol 2,3-dioxygenase-like lactoylglutathione lyase family enzyme
VELKLEVIVIPVSDVDRSKRFYEDELGFNLDVDHRAGDNFRVVQLTPPGSACSVTFGVGISPGEPGTYRGMQLVTPDIEAARAELAGRGVEVGDYFHFGPDGQTPGLHPERVDYGSYLRVADPDGNTWMIQEVRTRGGLAASAAATRSTFPAPRVTSRSPAPSSPPSSAAASSIDGIQ